jgi:hypothetical protein
MAAAAGGAGAVGAQIGTAAPLFIIATCTSGIATGVAATMAVIVPAIRATALGIREIRDTNPDTPRIVHRIILRQRVRLIPDIALRSIPVLGLRLMARLQTLPIEVCLRRTVQV